MRPLVLALTLLALAAAPAAAQQRNGARTPAKAPEKTEAKLGAMAFLRGLCNAPDAPQWSAKMKALVDAEGVSPGRRDRLAGAYNRGYRGFALTYRICTPAAGEAAGLYAAEGERLSKALAGRFGG